MNLCGFCYNDSALASKCRQLGQPPSVYSSFQRAFVPFSWRAPQLSRIIGGFPKTVTLLTRDRISRLFFPSFIPPLIDASSKSDTATFASQTAQIFVRSKTGSRTKIPGDDRSFIHKEVGQKNFTTCFLAFWLQLSRDTFLWLCFLENDFDWGKSSGNLTFFWLIERKKTASKNFKCKKMILNNCLNFD